MIFAAGLLPLMAQAVPGSSGAGASATRPKAEKGALLEAKETVAKTSPRVLTRVVGEVGEHVVTSREVRINEAIEQALSATSRTSPLKLTAGEAKAFVGEVGRVLDEWMVYLEAQSLSAHVLSRSETSTAVKRVQEALAAQSAWRALEVSAEELAEMVERKLTAKDFERLKSDPQLAPVTDEDALAYYRKNRLKFGSLPFSSFKDNIKSYLVQQQTERRWRDVLRRKYKVRNFISG